MSRPQPVRRQRRARPVRGTIEIAPGAWVEVPDPTPDELGALARLLARALVERAKAPHDR